MKPYVRARIDASQRLARRRRCRGCHVWVLVGPDADDVAYMVTVDEKPVSPTTEVVAVLRGRYSCDYDHGKLFFREPWHRGEWHYERTRTTKQNEPEHENAIHIEHRCPDGHVAKETLW